MTYQALARKHRPQRFEDVVGQEPVVRTLQNALTSSRLHHAYVFSGIRGIGKTTTARLLARALNCAQGPTPTPCGECPACTEITAGRSMDAVEIDAASHRGIDEVKVLIQDAQYSPARDTHKVFIVDEFHMLTREAFNALLKTLEEPPGHVVFILATTELERVPATILSRCLLLSFRPVAHAELRDHLLELAAKEEAKLEPAAAELLARKAGGSLRDAQSALDRVLALAGTDVTRSGVAELLGLADGPALRGLLRHVLEGRAGEAVLALGALADGGVDLLGLLEDLCGEARAVLLTSLFPDGHEAVGRPEAELPDLREIAALGSADDHRRLLELLLELGPKLRLSLEPRTLLEATLVRAAQLTRLEPLQALLRRLDDLPDGPPPPAPGGGGGGGGAMPAAPAAPQPQAPAPPSEPPPPAEPPTPTPPAPPAASAEGPPSDGGGGWRARMEAQDGSDTEEEDEAPEPPAPAPPAADAPPTPAAAAPGPTPVATPAPAPAPTPTPAPAGPSVRPHPSAGPTALEIFRGGLPVRLRALIERALIAPAPEGLKIWFPEDEDESLRHLETHRFQLMSAASEAFGRPSPVVVALRGDLLSAVTANGEIEGSELRRRRQRERAGSSPQVQAILRRFEGAVTSIEARGGQGAA
ncbi:MAG: DNA polymerase III subunit gamma/tau [Acidobacteriota bacterium]